MVVPKRILVNTPFSFDLSILTKPQESFKNMAMDIKVDIFRDWSVSPNTNSFRVSLVYSNISLISYAKCV